MTDSTKTIAEHLGDGAYVTYNGYEIIVTANHHDPQEASDKVYIDPNGIKNLKRFIERVDKLNEA